MISVHDLVAAQLYPSEEAALQDALRHLLRSRPEARIQLAVYQYQQGQLSLARAAAFAGVSWLQMRDILRERHVPLALGPENMDDAHDEVVAVRQHAKG